MPTLRVTPPVKVTSGSMPTRRIRPMARETIDWCTPSRMSSIFLPRAIQERTSDSAKTVQVVVMGTGRSARSAVGPSSSSGISSAADAAPRKRPVPAAHLSFMQKSTTSPVGPTRMALVSCPPMSTTVRVPGNMCAAPRAWQLISVTWKLPKVDAVAAVAGADDEVDRLLEQARVLERGGERVLGGRHHVGARVNQRAAHERLPLVDDDRLGLRRADVHACGIGHWVILVSGQRSGVRIGPSSSPGPRRTRRCGS